MSGILALAWSPDDKHLAVAISYTGAIESLQQLKVWSGNLAKAPLVDHCNGNNRSCDGPAYDTRGRILFTRIDNYPHVAEVRWSSHHVAILHRFPANRVGPDSLIVNAAGSAFAWQSSNEDGHHSHTDVWVRGRVHRLFAGQSSGAVWPILWH